MDKIKSVTINWHRSLLIDSDINDELIKRVTPQILALRQESNEPITIGIDSHGGSLASLDVLLGLLTGPDQDGNTGKIITVVTHHAYSAAPICLHLVLMQSRYATPRFFITTFGSVEWRT